MIKFLSKYKKLLIPLFIFYVGVIVFLVFPSGHSVITPGGITDISTNIEIEDDSGKNNFYSIYVTSFTKMTYFQYLMARLSGESDVTETSNYQKDISLYEEQQMGQVSKNASYQYSTIYAYERAKLKDTKVNISYRFKGLKVYYRPSKYQDIHINDLITGIRYEDSEINVHENMTAADINEMILLSKNANYTLIISRDNKETEREINLVKGDYYLTFYPDYEITSANPVYYFKETSVGGPSAGLMQVLSVYSTLLDYNYGNSVIAGTGTLDYDGKVGKIGGARQKVYTAVRNNVDYFFIDKDNYDDIKDGTQRGIKGMTELSFFKEYYIIQTLDEALDILEELRI